jgi:hypothetical protein
VSDPGDGPGRDEFDDPATSLWTDLFNIGSYSEYLEPEEASRAREFFDIGWHDRDASTEERNAAREQYYEITDTDSSMFDWDTWRELMGYE